MERDGASNNERLLAAARADNEDLLLEILEDPDSFDINYQDGLGNTALHYATSHCSVDVLEHILCHDECDVDPVNKLEKDTPLHLAVRTKDPKMRVHLVESLLEAGADLKVKNKYGETARDLIKADDNLTLAVFTTHQAGNDIGADDIASDDDHNVAGDYDVADDED